MDQTSSTKPILGSLLILLALILLLADKGMGIRITSLETCHPGKKHILILPEGKLPWPHQRPDISASEYQALLANLRITDNFASYHGTEDKKTLYMHDGLDIMLAAGTKLYAVSSGYVKALHDPHCLTIGDMPEDSPGYGWEYRHTTNFQFQVGEYVKKGDYICDVHEEDHLHLSRIRLTSRDWELKEIREYFLPDKYFVFPDTLSPEVVSPFFYFKNNSDDIFTDGSPLEVSGDVDIVVAIRDLSETTLNGVSQHPLSVAKIEYEISSDKIQTIYKKSFDFSEMICTSLPGIGYDQRVQSVYKHPFTRAIESRDWGATFLYYIITNMEGRKECCTAFDAYQYCSWNTSALDRDGKPFFPDGIYTITVMAYDSSGNFSTANDRICVRNRKKTKIRR